MSVKCEKIQHVIRFNLHLCFNMYLIILLKKLNNKYLKAYNAFCEMLKFL